MHSRSVGDDLAAPPVVMGILRMRGQVVPFPGQHAAVNQTDTYRNRVVMMPEHAPHHLHRDVIDDDPSMDDVALLAGERSSERWADAHDDDDANIAEVRARDGTLLYVMFFHEPLPG